MVRPDSSETLPFDFSTLSRYLAGACSAIALLAMSPAKAAIEITNLDISATVTSSVTTFIPNAPFSAIVNANDGEVESADAPLFVPESRVNGGPVSLGDYTAAADLLVPHGFGNEQPYVAAQQNITSNAVGARTFYIDALDIKLRALTTWEVQVTNTGNEPAPVDFSFYISGGGMALYCIVCPFQGITASVYANIGTSGALGTQAPWTYSASLVGSSIGNATLNTTGTGSVITPPPTTAQELAAFSTHDDLGIGLPTTTLVTGGNVAPYTVVEISDFFGEAELGMLDPGDTMRIVYTLGAGIAGVNSAYASAWLIDPFSLGSAPPNLPNAQFALNGIPVNFSAVPLPAGAWLLVVPCFMLRRMRTFKARPVQAWESSCDIGWRRA